MLTVMMVFGMAGRIAFGRLADRFGNLPAYAVASAGQTALAFLFPYMSTRAELYVLSALFGLVFSGAMTAFILCARDYSPAGRRHASLHRPDDSEAMIAGANCGACSARQR